MMIHGWLKASPKRRRGNRDSKGNGDQCSDLNANKVRILCIEGGKDLQKGDQRVAGGKGIKVRSSRGAASGT